ncbi:hypothetical protein D3C86_2103650 [compost metagenome]
MKDFDLALGLARQLEVPMKQSELAYSDYLEAMERGWGGRDSRVPMLLQNERAGVTLQVSPEGVRKSLDSPN